MTNPAMVPVSTKVLEELATFSAWITQTETEFRRQLKRWHDLSSPDEEIDIIFMEEPEFLRVLDGMKHTAEYLKQLSDLSRTEVAR